MTTLSDSKDRWPPEYVPEEPLSGREVWLHWTAMVMGASEALDVNLSAHTNGEHMGIVNLEEDTAPPLVQREALTTRQDVARAFRARIQQIEDWPEDPKDWGPGPWDYPEHFDGEVERE